MPGGVVAAIGRWYTGGLIGLKYFRAVGTPQWVEHRVGAMISARSAMWRWGSIYNPSASEEEQAR